MGEGGRRPGKGMSLAGVRTVVNQLNLCFTLALTCVLSPEERILEITVSVI
jgi:hypothetical protein